MLHLLYTLPNNLENLKKCSRTVVGCQHCIKHERDSVTTSLHGSVNSHCAIKLSKVKLPNKNCSYIKFATWIWVWAYVLV